MSECRSCDADVIWAVTTNGTPMLVNREKVAGGNVELEPRPGPPVARVVKPQPGVERYVSHFTTCPRAAEHRRR